MLFIGSFAMQKIQVFTPAGFSQTGVFPKDFLLPVAVLWLVDPM